MVYIDQSNILQSILIGIIYQGQKDWNHSESWENVRPLVLIDKKEKKMTHKQRLANIPKHGDRVQAGPQRTDKDGRGRWWGPLTSALFS